MRIWQRELFYALREPNCLSLDWRAFLRPPCFCLSTHRLRRILLHTCMAAWEETERRRPLLLVMTSATLEVKV